MLVVPAVAVVSGVASVRTGRHFVSRVGMRERLLPVGADVLMRMVVLGVHTRRARCLGHDTLPSTPRQYPQGVLGGNGELGSAGDVEPAVPPGAVPVR
ncbi:hypothetical protein ACPPVO_44035 [Dactylosporangium sp. McL0621]|uniref:hypothetical protein n=1 Tax=Dactylosporangium sp. McL0621 TaxID=3415678 RepID=UPI003CE81676